MPVNVPMHKPHSLPVNGTTRRIQTAEENNDNDSQSSECPYSQQQAC